MGNQYYKNKALKRLNGKWKRELGLMTVYLAISMLFITILTLIMTLLGVSGTTNGLNVDIATPITLVLSFGYIRHVMLVVYEGDTRYGKGSLFYYFTTKEVFYLLGLNLVIGILIFLWSILLIIPGLVMGVAYSQSIYIKIENKDKPIQDVIKESKELMRGHKWEYFILNLSFIGWAMLGVVTIVGIIPLSIYIEYTRVEYYKELRTNQGVYKDPKNTKVETVNLSKK